MDQLSSFCRTGFEEFAGLVQVGEDGWLPIGLS